MAAFFVLLLLIVVVAVFQRNGPSTWLTKSPLRSEPATLPLPPEPLSLTRDQDTVLIIRGQLKDFKTLLEASEPETLHITEAQRLVEASE